MYPDIPLILECVLHCSIGNIRGCYSCSGTADTLTTVHCTTEDRREEVGIIKNIVRQVVIIKNGVKLVGIIKKMRMLDSRSTIQMWPSS